MKKEDFLKIVKANKSLLRKAKFRKRVEDKRNCSFETLVKSVTGDHILAEGYFLWPKGEDPSRLAGPYRNFEDDTDWAFFRITDESCSPHRAIRSILEIHEHNKEYARTSRFSYPRSVLRRLEEGRGEKYWDCYVSTEICSRSELTEDEIEVLNGLMTPLEKMHYERSIASHICQRGELNPLEHPSKENPIKAYIRGNDDSSWTMAGKFNKDSHSLHENFTFNLFYFFSSPNWYHISTNWHFTN
jgi:hypothetical protein